MELSKLVNQLQEIAHLGYAMCNIEVRIVNPEADVIIENPTITPQVINNEKVRLVLSNED
jgi:hypothetical protein